MDSQVQEIKDKIAINEVVGAYVQLRRAGRNWVARCPFHKERTPSFHVSPERGTYMCFGCGEKGDIFSFVQKMDGVDFKTALEQLAAKAGVKLVHRGPESRNTPEIKEKDERLREVCEEAAVFFEKKLRERKDVQEYLRGRGVKDETVTAWRLGYAPASWEELCKHLQGKGFPKDDVVESGFGVRSERKPGEIFDRFRGRIMFPIFDAGGKVIAVSGRFFEKVPGAKDDEPAKYVNSPETSLFKKSKILYGFDRAKNSIRKVDCILLVEGQFDLVLSHQSGLSFAVALSGTALTPEHLSLLSRLSKRLVLALDADDAGLRSGLKSAQMALAAGFDVKVPTLQGGKDPADVAKEDPELLKKAVRESQTAVEFFLGALRAGARDERAYKKLVEKEVLPLIAAISSKIEQEHFVRIVAHRLGVSEGAVSAQMKQSRSAPLREEVETAPASLADVHTLPLERAAGMILFHFENDEKMKMRLDEIAGSERVAQIAKRLQSDAERLRFEFDSLGEDEAAIAQALLSAVERGCLAEEIVRLQNSIRKGGGNEGEVLKRLATLKHREQELRK